MGIEISKFSPKIEKEKYVEFFQTIYQEMKKVAQKTGFAKTYQKTKRNQKVYLNRSLEKICLKPLRDRLVKENPGYGELIFALVNLDSHEWQTLATYLLAKNNDKKFAQDFWYQRRAIDKLFRPTNIAELSGVKRGVIGQVGIFKAFEKLGITPVLATPRQDAGGADIFIITKDSQGDLEHILPVDVKFSRRYKDYKRYYKGEKQYILTSTKLLKILSRRKSLNIGNQKIQAHMFTYGRNSGSGFEEKIISWLKQARRKKGVTCLKIICSLDSFDHDTGEPTPEFLKELKTQIAQHI